MGRDGFRSFAATDSSDDAPNGAARSGAVIMGHGGFAG
jgi:hypothetical protein